MSVDLAAEFEAPEKVDLAAEFDPPERAGLLKRADVAATQASSGISAFMERQLRKIAGEEQYLKGLRIAAKNRMGREPTEKEWSEISEIGYDALAPGSISRYTEGVGAPEGAAEHAADIVGGAAPSLVAGLATGGTSFLANAAPVAATLGVQQGGQELQRSRAEGDTKEVQEARSRLGFSTGAVTGFLPGGVATKFSSPILRRAVSAGVGGALGAASSAVSDVAQARKVNTSSAVISGGVGALIGALLGNRAGPLREKLEGASLDEQAKIISEAMKDAPDPQYRAALEQAQAKINEQLGVREASTPEARAAREADLTAALEKPVAPADFFAIQPGWPEGGIADIELHNLREDIEGHPEGSTVSRQTLEEKGFQIPERRADLEIPIADRAGGAVAENPNRLSLEDLERTEYTRASPEGGQKLQDELLEQELGGARFSKRGTPGEGIPAEDAPRYIEDLSDEIRAKKIDLPEPVKIDDRGMVEAVIQGAPKEHQWELHFADGSELTVNDRWFRERGLKSPDAMKVAEEVAPRRTQLAEDFEAARSEESAEQIQQGIQDQRLAGAENVILGDDPVRNQITALDTRPGEAVAERSRLQRQIEEAAPDVPAEPDPELSAQAQRTLQRYGFIAPQLQGAIAGGTGGFLYGFNSAGDKPEDRLLRGLKFALAGAVGGAAGMHGVLKARALDSKEIRTRMHEILEDSHYRVRKLVEQSGVKLTDSNNIIQRIRNKPGREEWANIKKNDFAEQVIGDLVKVGKKHGVAPRDLQTEVNAYLQATHAPERNAVLGDGAAGMSDAEAQITLQALGSRPQFAEVKRIGDSVRQFNNLTLDVLLDGQVITKELYDELRKIYPNHVPLNRLMDTTEDVGSALGARGTDVRSTGIKRATGSSREVADILGNVLANYEQAVMRAEKNRIDLTAAQFMRDNPQLSFAQPHQETPIGTHFSGAPIFPEIRDPSVLQYRENGKPAYIKFDDPKLAVALRGVNRIPLDGVSKYVGKVTRLVSQLITRVPTFAPPNMARDLQDAFGYVASKEDLGVKSAVKTVAKQGRSMKAIFDHAYNRRTPDAALYDQMVKDGATTGGMSFSSRAKVGEELEDIWKRYESNPRKAIYETLKQVDNWNRIFEDSTRLSIYREALESGASRERAAFLAKEGTIDFNRMGTAGPVLNAWFMFSNASIQGSAKVLRAMHRNPKVATGIVATVTAAVWAIKEWNDSVDPEWKKKVSKFDQTNGLPIMLPGGKDGTVNTFVIPVSWGLKPIKVMADKALEFADGETSVKEAAKEITAATLQGYNPLGGSDIAQAVTPSAARPIVDILRNKGFSGAPIRPDLDPNAPRSTQYFKGLEKNEIGKVIIGATKYASDKSGHVVEISPADLKYALDQYTGGWGRMAGDVANVAGSVSRGEGVPLRSVPGVNRFLHTSTPEQQQAGLARSPELDEALEEQSRVRFYRRKGADAFIEKLRGLQPEDRLQAIQALDPDSMDAVKDALKRKTGESARIAQLGVENHSRAIYLYQQLAKRSPEQRAQYLASLDPSVFSPQVKGQLFELIRLKPLNQPAAAE